MLTRSESKRCLLFKLESYRKGIALSTIFNIVNKGLLFLISVIAVYLFGPAGETGIYFYAYNTVFYIAAFLTNLNTSVVIPESMRMRLNHGEKKAMQFLNMFIALYVLITIALCILFYISPVKSFLLISKFESTILEKNGDILSWSIPLLSLITVTNLLTDILVSYKYFTAPMLVGIFNGICAILFILLFHHVSGIKSILVGLIVAYSTSLIILIYFMHRKIKWIWKFRLFKIEKRIWKNAFFAQVGNLTSILVVYMPFYLLSSLGSGVITAINVAQQVAALPTALVATQFISVAAIKFNELAAAGDEKRIQDVFSRTGIFLLFLVMPCAGFIYLYGDNIVDILFRPGQHATEWRTQAVELLRILVFSIPLILVSNLMARLFMADHKIQQGFRYQTLLNLIYIVALIITVRSFGIIAYPLAYVGIYLVNVLFGFLFEWLYFPYLKFYSLMKYFGILLLANGTICLIIFFMRTAWMHSVGRYFDLILGAIVYLGLLFVTGLMMRIHRITDFGLLKIIRQ